MKVGLNSAWLKFNHACYKKLAAKERRGFSGWDKQKNKELLEKDLITHTRKPLIQSNLLDIANYCDFLWNLLENEKDYQERKHYREVIQSES